MVSFLLRRAASALLLIFIASSAAMLLTSAAPGDFASDLRSTGLTPAAAARERARLGLNRPILDQYADWLRHAARLDFGTSLLYRRPVWRLVAERAANTATLALVALLIATTIGLPLGIVSGSRARGWVGRAIGGASLVALSLPPLLTSLLLVLIAARTGWLPASGTLVVPAVALAIPIGALLEQIQSSALRETMRQPFVTAARARGVSGTRLVWRDALRPSLGPVLAFYGLAIGGLLSGSFIVEIVTAWPGLGRLTYEALRARDTYLVAGTSVAGAAFLAAGTFAADVAHAAVDPRTRTGTS